MKELAKKSAPAWSREPGECYVGFNDMGQFTAEVTMIPTGYLPPGFGCPFLEMANGQEEARDKAREAYAHLVAAHGILANFQKGISTLPLRPAEGLIAIDDDPDDLPDCKVCMHPDREAIEKALAEGVSLRDLEKQ